MAQDWLKQAEVVDETPVTPGQNVFIPASGSKAREEQRDQIRTDIAVETFRGTQEERTLNRFDTYRKEFLGDQTVKQFKEVEAATKQIIELAKRPADATPGPGDIALIFSYMKTLDPGSVVRTEEFATAENAGGVPETVRNAYNKLLSGGRLSPDLKREFANVAASIYDARRGTYNSFAETYRGLVQEAGGDPDKQGIRLAEPLSLEGINPRRGVGGGTRVANEGESFLTSADMELQAKLDEAYSSGATLEELQAIAAPYNQRIPIASQADLDAARAEGRAIQVTPTGRDPRADMGILGSIAETITGSERTTEEIAALPDAMTMPELNSASGQSLLAGLGTLVTGPAETVQVIQSQFPGVQVRTDEKGNFILRSSIDGQEYAIKPGFALSDIPRAIGGIAAFTPAGRAATLPTAATAGGITQTGIELSQAAAGGQFNAEEIPLAAAGNVAGQQLGRVVNAVRGPQAATTAAPRNIRDAGNVIATGEREGVPVLTSDVRPPRTWLGNWFQQIGEKIPIVGTGGQRAAQQESRIALIEKLADDYASNPATIDDVTADFMKTRGAEVGKFTQQKRDVFSSLAGAPPPQAQKSLDALDKAIGRFGNKETYAQLVGKLQGWRNDLSDAASIDDIEDLRKAIGDTFQDESMKSSSSALREIVDGPNGLYAAIKQDMGGYIKDNAGEAAFNKWAVANAELADFAGDLEKNTLERVLRNGEATPEEARTLLFSTKPSDVSALFKNLSPQGQERARALVVQELIERAGGIDELSTAKFKTALKNMSKDGKLGIMFPKADADRFAGILRLMQVTNRAEKAGVATPTGQAALPFAGATAGAGLGGGWLLDNILFGGLFSVGSLAAFKGYESKAVRNLLVSLSKTQPGSKAEANVLGLIAKAMPAAAAPMATREEQPTSIIEVR